MKKNKIVSLAGYLSLSLISLIAIEASQNMPRIIDFATQKFPKLTNKAKEVVGQIRETIDYEEMVITSPPTPPSKLEKKVESFIQEERKKDHVLEDERTAWFVYDLSAQEKVVSINEDLPLQAASMIKPFVALAFYHLEKQGKLIYGKTSRKKMEEMIQKSNNKSTNWVMEKIGGPREVEEILEENYPQIFKNIRIREYIPKGGGTYQNKASAGDYGRFLQALWDNQLPKSDELKRLMNLPGRDRLYSGVSNIPYGTEVYNKTGTTAHLIGDMGIISAQTEEGKEKQYALIGIIEKENKIKDQGKLKRWYNSRSNLIRRVSGIVYANLED